MKTFSIQLILVLVLSGIVISGSLNAWEFEFKVAGGLYDQMKPHLEMDEDGGFLVALESKKLIQIARYGNDGSPVTALYSIDMTDGKQSNPFITLLPNYHYACVYENLLNDCFNISLTFLHLIIRKKRLNY